MISIHYHKMNGKRKIIVGGIAGGIGGFIGAEVGSILNLHPLLVGALAGITAIAV